MYNNALMIMLLTCATASMAAQKICDAKAYGAKGDGKTKDTAAIQEAIDECSAAPGGVVRLARAETFVSAPLVLKSNIVLDIEAGTTLAASTDHDDFPEIQEFHETSRLPLLSTDHAENVTIKGGGTIDGRGESWWDNRSPDYHHPHLIVFRYSKHIVMENVLVENSPSWQIVPYNSDDLVFRNMKVYAPEGRSHNTDGIDPFSSSHILIDHVTIDTGDDNVAIKSGQPGSPGPDAPSHDITITNCTFLHGHGLSIGSEVAGGVQHVHADHITFRGTGTGVRIKSNRDRGNDLSDLTYRNLTMEDVAQPIQITEFYPKIPDSIDSAPLTRLTPHFHDITIENVTATGARYAGVVIGLPESPIKNLRFINIHITAKKGMKVAYADVAAQDFKVAVEQGKSFDLGEGVHGKLQ